MSRLTRRFRSFPSPSPLGLSDNVDHTNGFTCVPRSSTNLNMQAYYSLKSSEVCHVRVYQHDSVLLDRLSSGTRVVPNLVAKTLIIIFEFDYAAAAQGSSQSQ